MATLATGRSGVALVLASWCWLAAAPARAQWVPNAVPLCTAAGSQTTPFITSDGQGGAIVAWRDGTGRDGTGRDGTGRDFDTYLDIYAQRVTAEGMIAPGWPRDGVAVCADSAYQSLSGVASDGLGGAYFVWEDDRNYDASLTDVYLQRVSAEGAIVPGWTVNGNSVCTAPGDQVVPQLAPDGAGGVFVVWEDFRRTGSASDRSQVDLYAQHITPEGTMAPGWPVDGLPVRTAAGGAGCPNLLPDGVGGCSSSGVTHVISRYPRPISMHCGLPERAVSLRGGSRTACRFVPRRVFRTVPILPPTAKADSSSPGLTPGGPAERPTSSLRYLCPTRHCFGEHCCRLAGERRTGVHGARSPAGSPRGIRWRWGSARVLERLPQPQRERFGPLCPADPGQRRDRAGLARGRGGAEPASGV